MGRNATDQVALARQLRLRAGLVFIAVVAQLLTVAATAADPRAYQHGIDFVPRSDGNYWLVWSSSGNPPTGPLPSGNWPHDVYYSLIDPAAPTITPVTLIAYSEAQEPASSAISDDGRIMVTMEDGWTGCCDQRYGIYDSDFNPVAPYPRMVLDGGHSGHVVAVGNLFVVFFSEGWVDGGGVDDLGTGDDVLAKVYTTSGVVTRRVDVAVGSSTRDWWPIVAASSDRAGLLWQRFVNGQIYARLMYSVLDPTTGVLNPHALQLEAQVKYYTYSIEYISTIDRFLVLGAFESGGGFGRLVDSAGNVTAQTDALPPIVRESQSVVRESAGGAVVVQAISPSGAMVLSLTSSSITLAQTITDPYEWQYPGTDGIFTDPETVYMVSLSTSGLVERTFTLEPAESEIPTVDSRGMAGIVALLIAAATFMLARRGHRSTAS